ncbi:MAG: hypothetical protein L6R43_17555 [Planctomycetes bacterium]|nr:hypothetical protein [Planctomycetota bacterium]
MKGTTLLAGLAIFAAGAAAGWLLAPTAPGPSPAAPPAAAAPAAPAPAGPLPPPSPGTAPAAPAGPPVPPAPEAAGAPPASPRTGSITGWVLDRVGSPVAGVLVRATPLDAWNDQEEVGSLLPVGTPPPRRDVEAMLRVIERRFRRTEEGVREALTDGTGAFTLSGLPSEEYALEAWRVGFLVERTGGGPAGVVAVGGRCDFRATPAGGITLSLALPDGGSPEQAVVTWSPRGEGEPGCAEWRPGSPRIEVPSGSWEFTAFAGPPGKDLGLAGFQLLPEWDPPGGAEVLYRSTPREATVGAGAVANLALRLEARPGLRARVVFEGSRRPHSFRIAALPLEGGAEVDPALLLRDEGVLALWLDDGEEGILPGLAPGTWLVGATFRGGRIGAFERVTVAEGLAVAELRVPDIDPMDTVRVRVLDPAGRPLPGAVLESGCRRSVESVAVRVEAAPEPDGSLVVEHYETGAPVRGGSYSYGRPRGPGPMAWFLRATSPLHGTVSADYDPARDREVTLRFAAPAHLRVHLSGYVGHPHRDRVVLGMEGTGERKEDRPWRVAVVDEEGTAAFPPTAPGEYELRLLLAEDGGWVSRERALWRGTKAEVRSLVLPSGETEVTVHLAAFSDLVVTFEEGEPLLQPLGPDGLPGDEESGTPAGEGRVSFGLRPEGRYRLFDRDRGAMIVDLPAAGPVAFRPKPFDCMLLLVTGEGYLSGLGLRSGDLVVGVEGEPFADREGMRRALLQAAAKGTARFTILRGGAAFEVTAEVRRFMEDDACDATPWVK